MRNVTARSKFNIRFIGLVLFASTYAQTAQATPPIAFSEQMVVQGGVSGAANVTFQFYDPLDPIRENSLVTSQITKAPTDLLLNSGSAGSQSCAFFGACSFFTLDFLGTNQLSFVIGSGDTGNIEFSEPAVVTIDVVESIDRAIAYNLQAGAFPDTPTAIRPGGVAPGSARTTYTIVTQPINGTLDLTTANSRSPVIYTPDSGFIGVDEFEFTITDGTTVSEPAKVIILVGVTDVPVLTGVVPATGATSGGNEVTLKGFNLPASGLQVAFGSNLVNGTLEVSGISELKVTTPPNTTGPVDVRVTNSRGETIISDGFLYEPAVSGLVSAVLPAARSVQVGTDATAFAVIVNSGNERLSNCRISPATATNAGFAFQTTNSRTNRLVGTENVPKDIPGYGIQNFVFRFTPNAEIAPSEIELDFECDGQKFAASTPGVNTLLLSASSDPIPDVIAMVAVDSQNLPAGTLSLGAPNAGAYFAVATTNVGSTANVTVETETTLPVTISVCKDPGDCQAAPSASLNTEMTANSTDSFFFLVEASDNIPFLPESSRVFVRFRDADGVIRGSTSLAVSTD